jgi:hypothetical protein
MPCSRACRQMFHLVGSGIWTSNLSVTGPTLLTIRLPAVSLTDFPPNIFFLGKKSYICLPAATTVHIWSGWNTRLHSSSLHYPSRRFTVNYALQTWWHIHYTNISQLKQTHCSEPSQWRSRWLLELFPDPSTLNTELGWMVEEWGSSQGGATSFLMEARAEWMRTWSLFSKS